jgi:hypothetical protein
MASQLTLDSSIFSIYWATQKPFSITEVAPRTRQGLRIHELMVVLTGSLMGIALAAK